MKNNLAYAGTEEASDTADDGQTSGTPNPEFLLDLKHGLARQQKNISPKYFYDAEGSRLFDAICTLPEYYPTRTELSILHRHAREIALHIGPHAEIIEFGAGSMQKVRVLLDAMDRPLRYIPLDISGEHLFEAAEKLRKAYPTLEVEPLVTDYTRDLVLPPDVPPEGRRVGFFPGSTLGNFEPLDALRFMRMCAKTLQGGAMILGADLVKHPDTLHAAYNDGQGITADFNRNVLVRANRELGADFELDQFAHSAFYNAPYQRIEMHLMSMRPQKVRVGDTSYAFAQGETLHTENSYKFTVDGLHQLAARAGFTPGQSWTDPDHKFCLLWLDAPKSRSHA
ncbi:MAG: L-histidine N(alpha)-methyltransferase [Pseudomonadota bacterium]